MEKLTSRGTRRLRTSIAAVSLVLAVGTPVAVSAVTTTASAASSCPAAPKETVEKVQTRLDAAGFWIGGVDGVFGTLTRNGIMAFQKHKGLPPTGCIDNILVQALRTLPSRPVPPNTKTGNPYADRAHIDETKQLLYIVRDNKVAWVFNASTGDEKKWKNGNNSGTSITPNGAWRVFREIDGWRTSSLGVGNLYRPKYFKGGVAIHGSAFDIPAHPSSHGCVRVTIKAMDFMWTQNLLPMNSVVVVTGDPSPAEREKAVPVRNERAPR